MAEITNKKISVKEPAEKETREVFIPADQMNPKNTTMTVTVNGKNTIIQRGMVVNVPVEVYEVLKHKRMIMR